MNSTKVIAMSLLVAITGLYNSVQSMEDINNKQKDHKSKLVKNLDIHT